MQSETQIGKRPTRGPSFFDRHQVLVGLLGAGLMVGLALYGAILATAGLLGGRPAYAASTDVYGSPYVVTAAFPVMTTGAVPVPALLLVKRNGDRDVKTLSALGVPSNLQLVGARSAPFQPALAAAPPNSNGLLSGRLPAVLGLP